MQRRSSGARTEDASLSQDEPGVSGAMRPHTQAPQLGRKRAQVSPNTTPPPSSVQTYKPFLSKIPPRQPSAGSQGPTFTLFFFSEASPVLNQRENPQRAQLRRALQMARTNTAFVRTQGTEAPPTPVGLSLPKTNSLPSFLLPDADTKITGSFSTRQTHFGISFLPPRGVLTKSVTAEHMVRGLRDARASQPWASILMALRRALRGLSESRPNASSLSLARR